MKLALSLALLLAGTTLHAQAQARRDAVPQQRSIAVPNPRLDAFTATDPRPEHERCVPWFRADLNACHPVQFKIADGRCSRGGN